MPRRLPLFLLTFAPFLPLARAQTTQPTAPPSREFSLDLWDWTPPCRDLPTFRQWAADLQHLGATTVEISAPWNQLEPTPNHYDFSYIQDRLAIARAHHLHFRVRLNTYYNGATPAWYHGDFWLDIHGQPPQGTPNPPSLADERFWQPFSHLCTAVAAHFKGQRLLYSPFIAIHAELKFADWWNYDPSALTQWRTAIHATPRPTWLTDVLPDNPTLPDLPPIPPPTQGHPDTTPTSIAFIAFREHLLRQAVHRFTTALTQGDPHALFSAPLGESYRKESARFANLDYFGLSRGATQVVHSYDFYWHPHDPPQQAAFAVATFQGITQLPVVFEFDGPDLTDRLHYTLNHLTQIAQSAVSQGAGLKAANYSYSPKLPSTYPALQSFAHLLATTPPTPTAPKSDTILLFLSKWTTYDYREPTNWLHQAHYAAWQLLRAQGYPVRIINEDNLNEPTLNQYKGLYSAFSPRTLLPPNSRAQLQALMQQLPTLEELAEIPPTPAPDSPPPPTTLPTPTLNYPLAYHWLQHPNSTNTLATLILSHTYATPRKD